MVFIGIDPSCGCGLYACTHLSGRLYVPIYHTLDSCWWFKLLLGWWGPAPDTDEPHRNTSKVSRVTALTASNPNDGLEACAYAHAQAPADVLVCVYAMQASCWCRRTPGGLGDATLQALYVWRQSRAKQEVYLLLLVPG